MIVKFGELLCWGKWAWRERVIGHIPGKDYIHYPILKALVSQAIMCFLTCLEICELGLVAEG